MSNRKTEQDTVVEGEPILRVRNLGRVFPLQQRYSKSRDLRGVCSGKRQL